MSHSRQPLVNGERLVRYEVDAAMYRFERASVVCVLHTIIVLIAMLVNCYPKGMMPLALCNASATFENP